MKETGVVLMAIFASFALAGCGGKSAPEATAEMVKQLGGKLETDDKLPNKPVVMVDLRETAVTDAHLERLQDFPMLKVLALDGTAVSDAGLEPLKQCIRLERVFLRNTRVTGRGVQDLRAALPKADIQN